LRPKVEVAPAERAVRPDRATARATRVKLTFKEQRELETLPAAIEALERELHEITERMSRPDYHRVGPEQIKADRQRAEVIEHELAEKFERWSALEQRANATG
jgi:ABC transport system ATP-binding/permease protein